jgi:release factor glutamine methyltransferase
MSANLLPKQPNISQWLDQAAKQLAQAGIASSRLDAEIILAHTIHKGRTFLHAHPDDHIPNHSLAIADARLQLRIDRTPVAYIIGHKDFYGRPFHVTPATLIPRPESEMIITILKELQTDTAGSLLTLVDVGTGSGCLGITAKLELPNLDVTLLDVSKYALRIAKENADSLGAEVTIATSDLLSNYPFTASFIVANLPYVDPTWDRSPETYHEPDLALFAKGKGLDLIKKLIHQAPSRLTASGALILEADPWQHADIIAAGKQNGFNRSTIRDFIVVLQKN